MSPRRDGMSQGAPGEAATPRVWLKLSVAADRLSVSEKTLRRMIAEGSLPAYRFGPRLVRVDANELDALATRIPAAGHPTVSTSTECVCGQCDTTGGGDQS